jgi:large subunit ribosomal protein L13
MGGLKSMNFDKVRSEKPERILQEAVKGMLPKGPLGRQMFDKLKVYADKDHPHQAQQPQKLELDHSQGEV